MAGADMAVVGPVQGLQPGLGPQCGLAQAQCTQQCGLQVDAAGSQQVQMRQQRVEPGELGGALGGVGCAPPLRPQVGLRRQAMQGDGTGQVLANLARRQWRPGHRPGSGLAQAAGVGQPGGFGPRVRRERAAIAQQQHGGAGRWQRHRLDTGMA